MTDLSRWRMISVAALLALWVADGVVFILEYRKERRGPRFWWSFAGLVFLGTLTFSDFKLARLEQRAEQQLAWRRVTAEQRAILIAALKGHPVEVWVSFVGNDPEAALFRADIDEALRQAGLVTKYFSGWAMAVGLQLTNVPGPDHDLLLAAFTKAGLPIISVDPPREQFNGQLMIIVGSKPPPD